MRIGQNPSKIKGSPAYQPAQLGIATLTYIPALEGYFRDSLHVLKVHLASLRASLSQDYDLLVFDNGSCPEVIAYLNEQKEDNLIDWLHLSRHNVGKNGALNWIFSAMPNEYIVYTDSDVFFRPGWLEKSLELFEAFPQAGMVSAQPILFDFMKGEGQTNRRVMEAGPDIESSYQRLAAEIVEEYCDGINASKSMRQQFLDQQMLVVRNARNNAKAVTSATDMQFMLPKKVASQLVPLPIAGALTGIDAIEIPRKVESLGYWLLSTCQPLVWHLGNTLSDRAYPEVDNLMQQSPKAIAVAPITGKPPAGLKRRIKSGLQRRVRNTSFLKHVCTRLYNGLFTLLYEEPKK